MSYRLKRFLLGPPLVTERLQSERLSKVLALGVLAPDMISSSAYGTEQILNQLVQFVGLAAFTLLLPLTGAILLVLIFATLSYREVVMVYTKAGGSYVVSRDNFGPRVAQVAAVALIIDYILTVAVQVTAGTDALTSAFPVATPYHMYISIGVILVMIWGNLRGIREAGKIFALPTYLFVSGLGGLVVTGIVKAALGQLHQHPIPHAGVAFGHPGNGLLLGASALVVLRAFANGGSSLTGLEAVSNGVATFREPTGPNARRVLVVMAAILGTLVAGVSTLAYLTHAVPYIKETPTVIAQEARFVFGSTVAGKLGFYWIQFVTMAVLWTGGNTSFNGFPNLTSFVAQDAYLPRHLTRRGHRLAFSNGILILGGLSIALIAGTGGSLTALVAMYAIGVFVGFTMAGAGMVKHHLRERQPGYRYKIAVNGSTAVLSFLVVGILATVKFTQGAWLVVVVFPILVLTLLRLHRQYQEETTALEHGAAAAAEAPLLRRHTVFVLIERLDLAAARALQYARSLSPEEPRAIHFVVDSKAARELEQAWTRLGLSRVSLELIDCPDRRITRAALELVADAAADGQTEVSVLLPRRVLPGPIRRVFHGRTGERIAAVVGQLPNVAATVIPYQLDRRPGRPGEPVIEPTPPLPEVDEAPNAVVADTPFPEGAPPGTSPISSVRLRQRARVAGRVRSVRVQPGAGVPSLECTLDDATGQIVLVFQGRRLVPGVEPGARLVAEGMVGERARRPAMINPRFTLLPGGADEANPG